MWLLPLLGPLYPQGQCQLPFHLFYALRRGSISFELFSKRTFRDKVGFDGLFLIIDKFLDLGEPVGVVHADVLYLFENRHRVLIFIQEIVY